MGRIKKIKCCHCGELFEPDYRNLGRQEYCKKSECRKASKAASQIKWLSKPENKDHFKGPDHVERVKEWRRNNPGYWKRKGPVQVETVVKEPALQDPFELQWTEIISNIDFNTIPLQDSLRLQYSVIVGLISHITGFALQDDMAVTLRRMQQSGQDILYRQPQLKGETYECKNPHIA